MGEPLGWKHVSTSMPMEMIVDPCNTRESGGLDLPPRVDLDNPLRQRHENPTLVERGDEGNSAAYKPEQRGTPVEAHIGDDAREQRRGDVHESCFPHGATHSAERRVLPRSVPGRAACVVPIHGTLLGVVGGRAFPMPSGDNFAECTRDHASIDITLGKTVECANPITGSNEDTRRTDEGLRPDIVS